jgi:DNA-binding GntR family transcriptional regulator
MRRGRTEELAALTDPGPTRPTRIARRVLASDAYDVLKGMILDQVLPPDARVSIDLLAVELGVSQTPVREALARLEGDGLVTKHAHGRYWSTPMLTAESFEQLYAARLLLEPFAAGEAAKRIGRGELDALAAILTAMAASGTGGDYSQYGQFASQDARFHETIAVASGNPFVADAIQRMHSHLQLARLYRHSGVVDATEALADHRAILATLKLHDSRSTARSMKRHIERSRSRLRQLITGKKDSPVGSRSLAGRSAATRP